MTRRKGEITARMNERDLPRWCFASVIDADDFTRGSAAR
jgi:hypothetical protein